MAGWDTDDGTSVTATDRLRAMVLRRRRYPTPREHAGGPAPEISTSLGEDQLRLVSDFIGDDRPSDTPLERAAG